MIMTSAEAAKYLRKLNEEYEALLDKEARSREFNAASGEDVEALRPEYDYAATQQRLEELEKAVRRVKHCINCFNVSTAVPEFGLTIDEMLVLIPQLTRQKAKLAEMRSRLPRTRVENYGRNANYIDYTYANYDLGEVEKDFEAVSDRLSAAQTALDKVNSTVRFEVETL